VLNRRDFFGASLGAAIAAYGSPGDKFRWSCTSGMFRSLDHQPDATLKAISQNGFQGIEASVELAKACRTIGEFKAKLDLYHLACANFWSGGDYYNSANPAKVRKTVEHNIALARDYIAPCAGTHLKVNLAMRDMQAHPVPNWWTTEELSTLAKTLNEIGQGTAEFGVKFAIHPHNWTLIDCNYTEVKRIMDLTDPKLVYMVADTAHLSLGGIDPVKFVNDWFPRIVDVHLKDVEQKYSPANAGWTGPAPSKEEHARASLYKEFGAGGVDFVAFLGALRKHGYDGWVALDFDPPRPGEGSVEEKMENRRKYVIEMLHATLGS